MKKKKSVESVFENLEINENIFDIYEQEIPKEEHVKQENWLLLREAIKSEYKYSPFIKSEIFINFLIFMYNLDLKGINRNTIENQQKEDREFLTFLFELIEKQNPRMEMAIMQYEKMIRISFKAGKFVHEVTTEDVQFLKIAAAFYEYYFIKDAIDLLKKSDGDFAQSILNMIPNFIQHLSNASNLMKIEDKDIKDEQFYSNKPKLKGFKIFLTNDMLKLLKLPLEIIEEFNKKIFSNTITKEVIESLIASLNDLNNDVEFQFMFKNLDDVFGEHVQMSKRAKKILLHDIFMIYGHPMAITDDEELKYLSGPNTTIQSFEMRKIRIIESLIPDLK